MTLSEKFISTFFALLIGWVCVTLWVSELADSIHALAHSVVVWAWRQ
jgi:hypothetical protein